MRQQYLYAMLPDVQAATSVLATRQSFALTFCWINLKLKDKALANSNANRESSFSKPHCA